MNRISMKTDSTFIPDLEKAINDDSLIGWDLLNLRFQSEQATIPTSFHGLRSLEYLTHMEFLTHQIHTAQTAIEQMNGRAILADEVGLGKTIEAGLILKEYMVRGLVKKALILVPASLVHQWVSELNDKFHIPAISYKKNYEWSGNQIIISSIDTAKREENAKQIKENNYDLLLIDEAHKLKNNQTKNYKLVRSINKKFCLLLTATPIQNKLIEIFNLVSILRPGHLGNYETFLKRYGNNRHQLKEDQFLKRLIQKVMIRNTRKETNLNPVKRHIQTIWLQFTEEENTVYKQIEENLAELEPFMRITFSREICSSREACYLSLHKLDENSNYKRLTEPIIEAIEELPHHIKAKKVVELIQDKPDEKFIIFTEYRATQFYLEWYLTQHRISSVPFRGGFNKGKKEWMKQLFKQDRQVLIATEAGGEGINLQFCNHLINYDLPWNPMRLEQRIGRIHRYGQEKDVHIYNLAITNTIEEHVMKLLYEKLNLFENVIGDLDAILAELNISNIEQEISHILTDSTSHGERSIKFNHLTSMIDDISKQEKGNRDVIDDY